MNDNDIPAIEISNLYVAFDGNLVLEDINLTVEKGDYLGIIGPNGGGKSTLLRTILGLIVPERGTIKVLGHSPQDNHEQIGYVPQYALFDRYFPVKVGEVVLMGRLGKRKGLSYSRQDRQIAEQALQRAGVEHLKNRQIGELSGGERQRVLVARALATEPSILLLDEPTASVDPGFQVTFYELLAELNESMTIILVSHDISAVSRYVKRLACLNQRLFCSDSLEITKEMVEEMYHCPVDLIAHGIPHRVLPAHEGVVEH
ncbi:MAG TPA: ABC transporter ATP-binding protein [Syntrophomonadaceae bacterium]|nr:ABC transporter ATP-binding protein [Syntrophomonadaceae bacterium]HQE22779.1 ABC transporter ATP-binding protein [Syntrophomonadaceae bacterium]